MIKLKKIFMGLIVFNLFTFAHMAEMGMLREHFNMPVWLFATISTVVFFLNIWAVQEAIKMSTEKVR